MKIVSLLGAHAIKAAQRGRNGLVDHGGETTV